MFDVGDVLLNDNGKHMVEVIGVTKRYYKVRNCGLTEDRWESDFPKENVHGHYVKVKHTPKPVVRLEH
jgi:hypothetical protein